MSQPAPAVPLTERLLLTIPQTAAYLGVSPNKVYTLIGKGIVPTVQVEGLSDLRVCRPALDERIAVLVAEQDSAQAKPLSLLGGRGRRT